MRCTSRLFRSLTTIPTADAHELHQRENEAHSTVYLHRDSNTVTCIGRESKRLFLHFLLLYYFTITRLRHHFFILIYQIFNYFLFIYLCMRT